MILIYLWPRNKVSHQTWNELQGYNHAKFERSPLNSVCQKLMQKFLLNQKTGV